MLHEVEPHVLGTYHSVAPVAFQKKSILTSEVVTSFLAITWVYTLQVLPRSARVPSCFSPKPKKKKEKEGSVRTMQPAAKSVTQKSRYPDTYTNRNVHTCDCCHQLMMTLVLVRSIIPAVPPNCPYLPESGNTLTCSLWPMRNDDRRQLGLAFRYEGKSMGAHDTAVRRHPRVLPASRNQFAYRTVHAAGFMTSWAVYLSSSQAGPNACHLPREAPTVVVPEIWPAAGRVGSWRPPLQVTSRS